MSPDILIRGQPPRKVCSLHILNDHDDNSSYSDLTLGSRIFGSDMSTQNRTQQSGHGYQNDGGGAGATGAGTGGESIPEFAHRTRRG